MTFGAWVPITERLPRHNATVLVWRNGCMRHGIAQITKFRLTGDGPRWDADQCWPLPPSMMRRVTHWMPIPDGPEFQGRV